MANTTFQTRVLSRLGDAEHYTIYRAGLEWDLTEPIVIDNAEDFKSTPRWRERLKPFAHQVDNLITFCRRLPVTLLADDVGLGKTISAGLIMSELAARGRVAKTLIVCPKILGEQWKSELASKFDIPATVATGRALLTADAGEAGAVITTYNSARLYLDDIPEDRSDMLVLDEAHKLRNLYGVQNAPQVATKFRKALEARRFRFVLMLTATPIQNRLWDLYSLVDLLTVARGHENPFGTEGMFARRFIDDQKSTARRLKEDAREQFRSIVYNYMSRTRRDDAKLYFPKRLVQMHVVDPTEAELELIRVIAKPIQKMNKLAAIGLLKALVSSPDAFSSQLNNMARNGTAPPELAATVKTIVASMPRSAKLEGLAAIIATLKKQNKDAWRLVIFTTLRETQTTIQDFLIKQGLKVGIINGDSGQRNQSTIASFWKDPPDVHVIVSTEAGSEGVNLQVANILVNYDLPWNPMIVEQRIGRVQRLSSNFENVSIFNLTLKGTFEQVIVGRLMEKLQLAAHAIGDVESLLQGAGSDEEDAGATFEERILTMVLDALAGKNVAKAAELELASIDRAKEELEREEKSINEMLGSMDGKEYVGPRAPSLPTPARSMEVQDFTLAALPFLGAKVTPHSDGIYRSDEKGRTEYIVFEPTAGTNLRATVYKAESPPFQRLVKRVIASGLHNVEDRDETPRKQIEQIAKAWAERCGARLSSVEVEEVRKRFEGTALLVVRATVAHDSYERVVACECTPDEHFSNEGVAGFSPVGATITKPTSIGIDVDLLQEAAERDPAIIEFSRFYFERRDVEVKGAKSDQRKRQKLLDDFTPRVEASLAGLEGAVWREVELDCRYEFEPGASYSSKLTIRPSDGVILDEPPTELCVKSGRFVPEDCMGTCDVTGANVMQHYLVSSQVSKRAALPEFAETCALSGKRVLSDEIEISDVSGLSVARDLLKTCILTGRRGEPEHFGRCDFTNAVVLKDQLEVSEVSGKSYRRDEELCSAVSGQRGHKREFFECSETHQMIMLDETETCEITGKRVREGLLETCGETNKRVLPLQLGHCIATGQRVLRSLLVTSSVSNETLLKRSAIRSRQGKFCAPSETKLCFWSERATHPDDICICTLTGLPIHVEYTWDSSKRLLPLIEMLEGVRRTADHQHLWDGISERMSASLSGKKCRIHAAIVSPCGKHLAACAEVRSMLGLRVRQAASVFSIDENALIGRIPEGVRKSGFWEATSA